MTDIDTITDEPSSESRSSIPLSQLTLLPPAATASVPSKSVKPLMEHEGLSRDLALVLDAAQADISANYPPQRHRLTTPVGYVYVVSMRLLTAMVMVAAFNLRDAASRKRHLANARRAGRTWHPDFGLPKPSPRGGPGCIVEIESREQLEYWIRWERQRLNDPSLKQWIAEDTVLDATLIQPVQFRSVDGSETCALVAMDGSRRITNALDAMRPAIQADPSLTLAHCGDGPLRAINADDVKSIRKANLYPGADSPSPLFPSGRKDEDIADWLPGVEQRVAEFHRSRSIPANVIVGFEPFLDDGGQPVGTITDAVDSLLRQKHVMNARPKEWSRGDNAVLIGTRAISKLQETMGKNPVTRREEQLIDDAAADVLTGQASLEEALRPDGTPRFRDPLHALAQLGASLGCAPVGSATAKSVSGTLQEWRQPNSYKSRALIAADMAVHVIGVQEAQIAQVVAAIGGLFIGREFRDPAIKLPDGRTWHYLLDEPLDVVVTNAKRELAAGTTGPWSVLQSLYGGLALIVNPDGTAEGDTWTRMTQTGRGKAQTSATPDAIVRVMADTDAGLDLLADAAKQVSRRMAYGASAPMVALSVQYGDEPAQPMTELLVRELWNPTTATPSSAQAAAAAAADATQRFQTKCQALGRQVTQMVQQIEEIEGMTDESGAVLLTSRGIEPQFAAEFNTGAMRLMGLGGLGAQVWTSRSAAAPTLTSVEDDATASQDGGE